MCIRCRDWCPPNELPSALHGFARTDTSKLPLATLNARGALSIDLCPLTAEADIAALLQDPVAIGIVMSGDIAGIERRTGNSTLTQS